MKKRILSIILTLCMMLVLVPQTAFAEEDTSTAPSVSAYAARKELMDSTFAPNSDGTADNIGKLVFGKNSNGASQEWYILGADKGVSGENTIIFAASPIAAEKQFNPSKDDITIANITSSDSRYSLIGTYNYTDGTSRATVYASHYGISGLRAELRAMAANSTYFTAAEQRMMKTTTVTTRDAKNGDANYTTTDKLYALHGVENETIIYAGSSNNQIPLATESYWNNENYGFWLRAPHVDDTLNYTPMFTYPTLGVGWSIPWFTGYVQPASNLDLTSVLFASSAQAASSDTATFGTITSGTAMTLRLDGSNKKIGTVTYSAITGDIEATKGDITGDVALVVQGRNETDDWYYSKKITGTQIVNVSDIKSALGRSDIDLSVCKIWLETTDSTERMIYAVSATQKSITSISSVEITGIEVPTVNAKLDANAVCTTTGVSSTTPSVTWTPNDGTAGYNTTYTASVTLTADTFYQFSDSITVKVNGNPAKFTKSSDGRTLTVTYTFSATDKDKLKSITVPTPITVDNGTAYNEVNLPETVAIVTEGNTVTSASVLWDTIIGSYDPDVLTEQKVTLNGTVTCPGTIDPNGVSLTTAITITIKAADFVKTPKADLASGIYSSNQFVKLSTETEGAEIYYTTDGTSPNRANGTRYTGAISVTGTEAKSVTTTIKAIAVKDKMQDSSVETFTYTIEIPDTTAPKGKIKIDEKSWETFLNEITFGLFFKDTQKVTITASDNSGKDVIIEYLVSNKKIDKDDLGDAAFTTYADAFSIDPDNKYVIYARLTDASGNVKYINSEGIVLDSVVPVISGIENGMTYCSEQTFTVTEDYIADVTVNGKAVILDENNTYTLSAAEGAQTIVVTDKAGNISAEMTVTVNDGHRGGTASCRSKAICKYCGKEYDEFDSTRHINLEKVPAKDATVTETGNIEYWRCKDCEDIFSDPDGKNKIEPEDTVIPKLPPEIIEGKGQSIGAGEKKELSFTSNAAFGDFKQRVELDGKTLDEKNYTVKEGSTVVTLMADYVATLSVGEHTIGIVSESGTAATTFTVTAKTAVGNDTKPSQTGDNRHMTLWLALLFVSGALLTVTGVYSKKKKRSVK